MARDGKECHKAAVEKRSSDQPFRGCRQLVNGFCMFGVDVSPKSESDPKPRGSRNAMAPRRVRHLAPHPHPPPERVLARCRTHRQRPPLRP
jgi:hypothetical protein